MLLNIYIRGVKPYTKISVLYVFGRLLFNQEIQIEIRLFLFVCLISIQPPKKLGNPSL